MTLHWHCFYEDSEAVARLNVKSDPSRATLWSNNFVLRGSSLARRASEGFTFDNGLPSLARFEVALFWISAPTGQP